MSIQEQTHAKPVAQHRYDFSVATMAASFMLAVFFGLAVFSGTIFIFTRGPSVGFEQISSALPQALILLMFIYFLKRGNPFAGIVFGLWCMWGFFGIISDPGESFVMIFTYMWGILNVVGLMGVFRSFIRSKKKVSP